MLAVLAMLSLALKLSLVNAGSTADFDEVQEIADLLSRNHFRVRMPEPFTDPAWVSGIRNDCELQVASVSPQGWHRDVIDWHAGSSPLIYAFGGQIYDRQPVARTMAAYYLAKFARHLGLRRPPVRVVVAVSMSSCPKATAQELLVQMP